jgi:hypothetical protein
MPETPEPKRFPAKSIETQLIEKALLASNGAIVTDEELEKLIGLSVKPSGGPGYGRVQSAIRSILHDQSLYFVRVRNTGWRRGANPEVLEGMTSKRQVARNACKASKRIAGAIDVQMLDPTQRTDFHRELSTSAVIVEICKPAAQRKLQGAIEKVQDTLPVQKTLAAFLGTQA